MTNKSTLKKGTDFEIRVSEVLKEKYGQSFAKGSIREVNKEFDFVSEDKL